MRILLTGGGTAGHIYPLLSVLDELRKQIKDERIEVLYIGAKGGIEEKILKDKNIPTFFIYSGKWRRYWYRWLPALLQNFLDLFKVLFGFFQVFFVLIKFQPDIIFAKGGYVTIPIVLASRSIFSPLITHESDVEMGISNRFAAFFAKKICVSFPIKYYPRLPKSKLIETGNPVRPEFFINKFQTTNYKLPTLLITGGSQGSTIINKTILEILPKILKICQVVHIAGFEGYEKAKQKKEELKEEDKKRYFVYDFLEEGMAEKMQKADLVISRSGEGTLSEIAALGKPSILIPLKNAAKDHQRKNAKVFEEKEASTILIEEELKSKVLFNTIKKLLNDKKLLKKMGENAKTLSYPNAAEKIVEVILEERRT